MVVSWRHRQEITWCFGAKVTFFVIFAMALVSSATSAAPPLSDSSASAFTEAIDDTPMPDASLEILSPHLIKWYQDSVNSIADDSLPEVSVSRLLQDPSSSRGVLHRIEGRLQDQRSMASPHDDMEEWFIRLSSGEPLALYVPAGQPEFSSGQFVQVEAYFYKVLKARASDGRIRRYPVFLGGRVHPLAKVAGDRKTWQQMDILMLLGFMLLLVVVLVVVMLLARRQLPSESRKVVSMVDQGTDVPDDPAAALRELRSRAGGEQT